MKNNPIKYKIIDNEIQKFELGGTTNCPECGSLMRVTTSGLYEEVECMGCGYTETTKLYRPVEL
jgi:predicted RNA-binding Zn-ribbon protein involved in translation (DUF1610 family)